jgi:glycerophosphoryl diester phosphodiesterase
MMIPRSLCALSPRIKSGGRHGAAAGQPLLAHGLVALVLCLFPALAFAQAGGRLPAIAHAGGGYAGNTYTNSIEALDANAASYELFEIDFVWTSDGELVCLHDWAGNARRIFGRGFDPPPTLAEFEEMAGAHPSWTNCTLNSLAAWLDAHPDERVVTDVKDDNVAALRLIAEAVEDFPTRVIPQIYQPEEYGPVRDLGYRTIIWTLYQYDGTNEEVLRLAPGMELFAVTMPRSRAETGLPEALGETPTFVHTVNDPEEAERFFALGIDGIYTDWLSDGGEVP